MTESAFHEFNWIARLRQKAGGGPRVPLGIGDDAALVWTAPTGGCLVTTDMLMEGTDFLFEETPWSGAPIRRATPREVGRKALAVNLSDIAAMAGNPTAVFVAVALPRRRCEEIADGLLDGIQDLAREYGVVLAGGDTNVWDGPLVVSITLLGEPTERGAVSRSGARPGDWLLATGAFGGSLLGRHLAFTPRVREAQALHRAVTLDALIDVSDGLAQDATHLARESGVGLRLDAEAIPIHADARRMAVQSGRTALAHALSDGEDFELLLAVPADEAEGLIATPSGGVPLSKIGEFTEAAGVRLRGADGTETPLVSAGWVHGVSGEQARPR